MTNIAPWKIQYLSQFMPLILDVLQKQYLLTPFLSQEAIWKIKYVIYSYGFGAWSIAYSALHNIEHPEKALFLSDRQ